MSHPHHVIYLPGLGDPRRSEQNLLPKIWKPYGVTVIYHPLHWRDNRPFEIKLKNIVELIDDLTKGRNIVSLVGVSAGASAAINAYARRKDDVNAVVCICGKINNPETVSKQTFDRNPSFKESLALLPDSLKKLDETDRKKVLSLHPIHDGTVPIGDTIIEGASNKKLLSVGHAASIFYADTLGSYRITRFIKVINKQPS